jgi:hypothetical protein
MCRADNLHGPIVMKSGSFDLLEPSGPVQGLLYHCLYLTKWEARIILPVQQCNRLGTGSPVSGARDYYLLSNVQTSSNVYPPSYSKILSSGYSSWDVTLTTHHHKSIEVKNKWSYTSTPPMCLNGMDRDNFTFPPPPPTVVLTPQNYFHTLCSSPLNSLPLSAF